MSAGSSHDFTRLPTLVASWTALPQIAILTAKPTSTEIASGRSDLLGHAAPLLATMDFFTVPTATFRVLYVFFVIHYARRTVLHVHVTEHPTAAWIIQQLREAFAYDAPIVGHPRLGGRHHRYA